MTLKEVRLYLLKFLELEENTKEIENEKKMINDPGLQLINNVNKFLLFFSLITFLA